MISTCALSRLSLLMTCGYDIMHVDWSAGGSSGAPEGELLVQLYDGAIGQTRLAQAQVCPWACPMQCCYNSVDNSGMFGLGCCGTSLRLGSKPAGCLNKHSIQQESSACIQSYKALGPTMYTSAGTDRKPAV